MKNLLLNKRKYWLKHWQQKTADLQICFKRYIKNALVLSRENKVFIFCDQVDQEVNYSPLDI